MYIGIFCLQLTNKIYEEHCSHGDIYGIYRYRVYASTENKWIGEIMKNWLTKHTIWTSVQNITSQSYKNDTQNIQRVQNINTYNI